MRYPLSYHMIALLFTICLTLGTAPGTIASQVQVSQGPLLETAALKQKILESSHVLRMIPLTLEKRNDQVSKARIQLVELIKGDQVSPVFLLDLPNEVMIGQEYLAFLKSYRDIIFPVAEMNSLFPAGSPEYDLALTLLKEQNHSKAGE